MKAVIDPDQELLERTLKSALRVDAPDIQEDEARERAEQAIARARAVQRQRGRMMVGGVAIAVAAAIALVVWAVPPTSSAPIAQTQPAEEPVVQPEQLEQRDQERVDQVSSVRLPSGDRLVADPGAHYDVESTSTDRSVRLSQGEVLFDVAPLDGGSFTVHAGEIDVRVRGTVFSVRRERHVEVEVFEGSVEVSRDGERVLLQPGDRWSSAGVVAVAPQPTPRAVETAQRLDAPSVEPESAQTVEVLTLAQARARLRDRDFEGALSACEGHDEPAWRLLRADALRGLRRWQEAAEAYDAASSVLGQARQAQASYAAARIWFDRTGDANAALNSLRSGNATAVGSPLEERARALEINLLRRLGRDHESRAREYVERFPQSSTAFELRRELD